VSASLPTRPPFALRARLLTPLDSGDHRYQPDAVIQVDETGTIRYAGTWRAGDRHGTVVDLRPMVVMPGLVDLHAHLPQVPSAGIGAGLDLLTWLERYIFPLERGFDGPAADALVPRVYRALAAAGTTTVVAYGALWPDSMDAAFRAAEQHGIRAVLGKVMMDRVTYDDALPPDRILDTSLRQSAELCERWHGRDAGRLQYAFTPRFAVSCTADLLRESAALAASSGAYWQTHLSEDRGEIETVRRLFPEAIDYADVYDRAGGLGPRSILAHAIHLSDREVRRIADSGARIAHCPVSNMFLASGVMPLARHRAAGIVVGLGSDVAGSPELSIITQMRTGFYTQNALRVMRDDRSGIVDPLGWLRMGSLEGARALGLERSIGSVEVGKEADLIVVDPSLTLPPGGEDTDDPATLVSRLIFRERAGMVRGAWVRGRLLDRE
jgi:guanine deaminase